MAKKKYNIWIYKISLNELYAWTQKKIERDLYLSIRENYHGVNVITSAETEKATVSLKQQQ